MIMLFIFPGSPWGISTREAEAHALTISISHQLFKLSVEDKPHKHTGKIKFERVLFTARPRHVPSSSRPWWPSGHRASPSRAVAGVVRSVGYISRIGAQLAPSTMNAS